MPLYQTVLIAINNNHNLKIIKKSHDSLIIPLEVFHSYIVINLENHFTFKTRSAINLFSKMNRKNISLTIYIISIFIIYVISFYTY